jgi:integrase/recombinase XerD
MPRLGQKLKPRRRARTKPRAPQVARENPLAHHLLTRYMEAHFEWMRITGYSNDTIRARSIALKRFIAWAAERGIEDPREITKPILERYQKHLFYYRKPDGRPLTLGTQFGCLAPLKTWFKWLAKENHLLYNPASELTLPKTPKHLPRSILSVVEIEAILNQAEPTTAQGIRDRAMLETLYSTGLRRMELPGLALYDVDLNRRLVFVREGKGKRDRVIPIGQRACAWVEKYLREARPELATGSSETLFLTDYGEAISPEFLAAKVKRYMQFAGVDKPGATHLFRHACATHMLEGGADIRFIQAMLGHASLQTTEIYTHVAIDKLREIHDATHPGSRGQRTEDRGQTSQDIEAAPGNATEAPLRAIAREDDGDEPA